jgi:hypothetical protein
MKKTTLLLAASLVSISIACAQKAAIDPKYVDLLIKTLSSDAMQGRKTFEPGNKKASDFIVGEFKKIGLQPLTGLKGYEQTFAAYRTKPGKATLTVNNRLVAGDSVLVISGSEKINWTNGKAESPVVVTVSASDNLQQKMGEIRKTKKDALVLIDPSHSDLFAKYKNYYGASSISTEKTAGPTYILALTTPVANPTFTVMATNSIETLPLNNVVGVLPGKSKKEELVIFSGHYDHIGTLTSVNGDSIANGADDDASGTTAVIALAKHFKQLGTNERTLIFVAFTAEEIGGYGSQYFSKQLDANKVVAMFNIEMIGKESKFGKNGAFITGYEKTDFGKILQKNLEGTAFTFHPDPYPDQNLFYRSDNATLAKLGVPAHTISTDQIDSDKLYHSVDDEYESINLENLISTIKAIALSSRSIVAGKDSPTRVNTSDLK